MGLVVSSPDRPAQQVVDEGPSDWLCGQDDRGDEVAGFVDSDCDRAGGVGQIVRGGGGFGLVVADREGGQRECDHGQCRVPVPAVPGADLGVVEAELVLGDLEGLFDGPSGGRRRRPG